MKPAAFCESVSVMKLLAVDTALGACSAAVLDENVLAYRMVAMDRGHAEALAPMVAAVMKAAGLDFAELDRLAVTSGPGTFTGQRIGLAFMRALKVALNRPLNGVTSLAAMGAQALEENPAADAVAVLHDARRGEVYLEITGAVALAPAVLAVADAVEKVKALSAGCRFVLAGTAAPAVSGLLALPVSPVTAPDARWVGKLAAQAPAADAPPRPLYLRAPDAKLPAAKPSLMRRAAS